MHKYKAEALILWRGRCGDAAPMPLINITDGAMIE